MPLSGVRNVRYITTHFDNHRITCCGKLSQQNQQFKNCRLHQVQLSIFNLMNNNEIAKQTTHNILNIYFFGTNRSPSKSILYRTWTILHGRQGLILTFTIDTASIARWEPDDIARKLLARVCSVILSPSALGYFTFRLFSFSSEMGCPAFSF